LGRFNTIQWFSGFSLLGKKISASATAMVDFHNELRDLLDLTSLSPTSLFGPRTTRVAFELATHV
jgi:hypothetical protein